MNDACSAATDYTSLALLILGIAGMLAVGIYEYIKKTKSIR